MAQLESSSESGAAQIDVGGACVKKISVGICCYNEEENIEPMYQAVTHELKKFPDFDYEIIFEDNASTDGSQHILRRVAKRDSHVQVILNMANFGVERSCFNCMRSATGDAFLSIPCDFEEPPEMIPAFIDAWAQGHQVVLGQKTSSDERRLRYALRGLYYRIINWFSDYDQIPQVTGFGIYDRKIVDLMIDILQYDPYISARHILPEYGIRVLLIPYKHGHRLHGHSSYTPGSYLTFAISSLCTTSTKPLRIITLTGLFGTICGTIACIVSAFFLPPVYVLLILLLAVVFLLMLGVGMVGEYLSVVLRKVTKKPAVVELEEDGE